MTLRRSYGMKSGVLLTEFKGHESFVHKLCLIDKNTQLVSASADGTLKVYTTDSDTLPA